MNEPQNSSYDRDWNDSSAAHKGAKMVREELEPRIQSLEERVKHLEDRLGTSDFRRLGGK
jgi:hypothetical protein